MREYKLSEMDKSIIHSLNFREGKNGLSTSGRSAKKNIVLNFLYENGMEYRHLAGNTYEVEINNTRYLMVISCYGESRKHNSSYTVGKETADGFLGEYDGWHCLFAEISEEGSVKDLKIGKGDELILTEHPRSSGKGVYHAIAKNVVDEFTTFEDWYKEKIGAM